MNCKRGSNGRVNIQVPSVEGRFRLMDAIPTAPSTDYRNATAGSWYATALSEGYFSGKNIASLQAQLRQGVLDMSSGKVSIGQQDEDVLKIIMRSIFLTESKNLPGDIPHQIASLNKKVLDYAIPQVYGEAQGYLKYCDAASSTLAPLPPPINVTRPDMQLFPKPWLS